MPYAVKLYAYIFIADVLAIVIVARWVSAFGFMVSEHSLRFGVRLSDDCHRSVAVRAKGTLKAQPQACDLEKRPSITAVIDRWCALG